MKTHKQILRMVVLAMFGALMFAMDMAFEALPNIHPVAMLIMVVTVAYRKWALVAVYIYVLLMGLFYGFQPWWIPYLYVWAVLWGATMLLPKKLSPKAAVIVYPIVCGLFGLAFGTLYAPAQAVMFGYDFATTLKWIAAGLYFDMLHCLGNIGMGLFVYPLSKLLIKLNTRSGLN